MEPASVSVPRLGLFLANKCDGNRDGNLLLSRARKIECAVAKFAMQSKSKKRNQGFGVRIKNVQI